MGNPGQLLTDGTGVSRLTIIKVVKDFVADFLLSASAALVASSVMDVQTALNDPRVVSFAIAGAFIRAGYRAVLHWATT